MSVGHAAGEEPVGLVGGAAADQRQLCDLAQRRRRVELRELRAGGDEQDVRILQHLGPLERPFRQRQVGECQVELAVLEQAHQIRRVALLAHANRDARPLRAKAADESGEEAGADALVDADAKRPGLALGQRGHVGPRGVELRDDLSAWPSSRSPASVGSTRLGPPGRSKSRWPTIRSSWAICWLTADWV